MAIHLSRDNCAGCSEVRTASIIVEYFGLDKSNNKVSLGKYFATPGATGEAQFLGVLFGSAVVSDIEITVGNKALFSFDGTSIKTLGSENLGGNIDLVVTDDFFFAVPEALQTSGDSNGAVNCFFEWAENNYPGLFAPAGVNTLWFEPYIYRYYVNTNSYLGVSVKDNHVYYLNSQGGLQDVGESGYWFNQAGCR